MGFSRQEYWSGLPFSSPGDLPDPGIKPRSPALQADALTSEPPGKPVESQKKKEKSRKNIYFCFIDYAKAFDCVDHDCGKVLKRWEYQITHLPPEKTVCRSRSNS